MPVINFHRTLSAMLFGLYYRFTLSFRDVEELLSERGIDVSYESVRRWVIKFGPMIGARLIRRRPQPDSRWRS